MQGHGSIHDRKANSAMNLKNLAMSTTVSACGEEGVAPHE
jgi:putative transposase